MLELRTVHNDIITHKFIPQNSTINCPINLHVTRQYNAKKLNVPGSFVCEVILLK